MKTVEFKTGKAEGLFVLLPEIYNAVGISSYQFLIHSGKLKEGEKPGVKLPPGNWIPVGYAADITEEQWKKVVEEQFEPGTFPVYTDGFQGNKPNAICFHPKTSGISLMKSLGCYLENPYGETVPNKDDCRQYHNVGCDASRPCCVHLWTEAQEMTGNWYVLLKIKY